MSTIPNPPNPFQGTPQEKCPCLIIVFDGAASDRYRAFWHNQPSEGQFTLAGMELSGIAQIMRENRQAQQVQVTNRP